MDAKRLLEERVGAESKPFKPKTLTYENGRMKYVGSDKPVQRKKR